MEKQQETKVAERDNYRVVVLLSTLAALGFAVATESLGVGLGVYFLCAMLLIVIDGAAKTIAEAVRESKQ